MVNVLCLYLIKNFIYDTYLVFDFVLFTSISKFIRIQNFGLSEIEKLPIINYKL